MADDAPSSSTSAPDVLAVDISVLSPSVAVNAPLNFASLPPSTTIGQIKQKIRDALDSKPSNAHQRLIHQGKLLAREQDTLLDVFGEQRLRESNQLIFHLVIREAPPTDNHPSPSQATAPRGQSPAANHGPAGSNPFAANPQASPHNHHGFRPGRFARPAAPPGHTHAPFPAPQFAIPGQPAGGLQAHMAQQEEILQNYLNQIHQRAAGIPGQQQVPGMANGGQAQPGNPQFPPGHNMQGRNSPHTGNQPQTFVQHGTGPNGEFVRVTVNSAIIGPNGAIHVPPMGFQQGNFGPPAPGGSSAPGGPLSTHDVQNILRTADASEQASSIMANAMQRSASGASLPNIALGNHRQPIQTPGVTVPRRPGSTVPLSRTATPDATRTPSYGSTAATQSQGARSSPAGQSEVYILNSPQGPRALLINGLSDMYYTPAARAPPPPLFAPGSGLGPGFVAPWAQPPLPPRGGPEVDVGPQAQPQVAGAPAQQQAPQQGNVRVGMYQAPLQPAGQQQQQQQQQQARLVPNAPAAGLHPANPEEGVAGALLAALWPHIWLIIRLTVLVWWFTNADTTWTRWLTVLSIAIAIFIVNTGILNNVAHDLFNPLRQHLEGLIPFGALEENRARREDARALDANAQPGQGVNNAPAAQAERQRGEPDPAQAAARLIQQRRVDNGNWLFDQIRRLERAGLLFLASIAPGVAERHIANMEAAERAERERVEAAERAERERREEQEKAAADAAAAAASTEGEGAASSGQPTPPSDTGTTEQQQQQPAIAAQQV